mgnify:FL=1
MAKVVETIIHHAVVIPAGKYPAIRKNEAGEQDKPQDKEAIVKGAEVGALVMDEKDRDAHQHWAQIGKKHEGDFRGKNQEGSNQVHPESIGIHQAEKRNGQP